MRAVRLPTRREVLLQVAAAAAGAWATPGRAQSALLSKTIPKTGERLPLVGLGSWITFNVGSDRVGLQASLDVLRAFFAAGGRLLDCSPMYGSSQNTIGWALKQLGPQPILYAAEKVWTGDGARGAAQIETTRGLWGVPRFDLLQVHNLLAWQEHLPRLFEMKASGRLRHVGITTSHGRRHAEIEQIMRTQAIDFVQISYSLVDRDIEARILPLAAERGIGVIVNRPFREGALLADLRRHPLPGWAAEIGCTHWAQAALKFVVSHPAVTCAIPATRQAEHLRQNMAAAQGALPDTALRRRMAADVAAL